MQVEVLIDDPGGRFHKGEVGTVLELCFSKYDYSVLLPGCNPAPEFLSLVTTLPRLYFFNSNEVREIDS